MNSTLPSPKSYDSRFKVESRTYPGVRFTLRRMSFGGRLELLKDLRDLAQRAEFSAAGQSPDDKLAAALLEGEVRRRQIRWGLLSLEGLEIDGVAAGVEQLLESGPEELVTEVQALVRAQMGLNEEERKN